MKQEEIRDRLIDGAICVVARDGLDKATAKAIQQQSGLNVVYIYRCFDNKDDLLAAAFASLDRELIAEINRRLPIMWMSGITVEDRCRMLFAFVWKFLLQNRDKCLTYVRYYYSPNFQHLSLERHRRDFRSTVTRISVAFKEEADVWMILNHILNVLLDFASKVHNGEMSSEDDYTEHVFRVIYQSVKQYFKRQEETVTV